MLLYTGVQNKFHQANQINPAADNTLFVIKTDSHEIIHLVIYTQEILHLFRTDWHEIIHPVTLFKTDWHEIKHPV